MIWKDDQIKWNWKDWRGNSHNLFLGTILAHVWIEWRKQVRTMLRIVLAEIQNRHLEHISHKCYCLSQLAQFLHGVIWSHSRSTSLDICVIFVHVRYMLSNFPEAYSVGFSSLFYNLLLFSLLLIYQQYCYSGPGQISVCWALSTFYTSKTKWMKHLITD